jgi:hypothetical protein
MAKKVARTGVTAKSGRFLTRNQNCLTRNQISPVMQKVRDSLTAPNRAEHLSFLTKQPLSTCQKLLSGHLTENPVMTAALFRTHLITDAILGLTEGATDPTARAVRKLIKKLKLEQQLARLDAGDDE